jgi:hypothetical protein
MSAGVFADAATEEGAAALVRATPNADILVNNLGIYEVKEFNAVEFAERTQTALGRNMDHARPTSGARNRQSRRRTPSMNPHSQQ